MKKYKNKFRYIKTTFLILILILLHIIYKIQNSDDYWICQNCINNLSKSKECQQCKPSTLFKSIKINSRDDTLNEIIINKKSIARFGDGEFMILFGKNIKFQKYNEILKDKLLKVLNSNIPNLLVGIMNLINPNDSFWGDWLEKNKFNLAKIINKDKIYYSYSITRFYSPSINRKSIKNYITKFKTIWDKRDILIIEGEKTRIGVGNDLFNNSKSIKRIICPAENAFNSYEKILKFVTTFKLDKKTLILISLGPTATVLVYDLHKLGNQIIDFGHFDINYEYYLRNATKKIKIPNKYVNEVSGGSLNISSITDLNYYKQIIFNAT